MLNSLANEFKNNNVKIVSVKPGCIITPFWNKSIYNNSLIFENSSKQLKNKYEKEMNFMFQNAKKNNYQGTLPMHVAKKIYDVVSSKTVRLSYTVGFDSFLTMFLSKILSQNFINFCVRFFMKMRMK